MNITSTSRILLVGAFSSNPAIYTYASSFFTTLKKLDHTVESFNYRKKHIPYFSKINSLITNKKLLKKVLDYKPELVFFIKAENIFATTIQEIKKISQAKIINFYPDNPFALWNGNSNSQVLASLPLYDCFLSWSHMLTPALLSAGCKHVCYFPFAYDEDIFLPIDTITYNVDVCFIGTWEPEREQWLAGLQKQLPDIKLAIWGNDWHKKCQSISLKKIVMGNAIYGPEMIKAFQSSKIVLNFIRKQNLSSHNMRTCEVPASKSFLLTQRTIEQAELLFKENEQIACFETVEELEEKILFYLDKKNEEQRKIMIKNGHKQAQEFTITKQLKKYFHNCPALDT